MTDVVAALIWDRDRFLACQRPAGKSRGLLWEFVGGKIEPGETLEEALIRECREELDVTVSVGEKFMVVVHEYPDITIRLSLFNARIAEGTPKMLEHNDIAWIQTSEIPGYNFCPADKDILKILMNIRNELQAKLYSIRDESYKNWNAGLIPTISPDKIMGVRMPQLRKLAKTVALSDLSPLPHDYFEEDCLHSILISGMKEPVQTLNALDEFLPYVDNWAICDLLSPKSLTSAPEEFHYAIEKWIQSDHSYTVRFAIGMLMKYYLDERFNERHFQLVASAPVDDYYVKMMIAWYFATALAKQPDSATVFLESKTLDPWVHNKTIQKAVESYRISAERKQYLKSLRMK